MSISKRIRMTSGGNPEHSYSIYYKKPDNSIVLIHNNLPYADFFAGHTINDLPDNTVSLLARSNSTLCNLPLQETTMPNAVSVSPSASNSPSPSPTPTPSAEARIMVNLWGTTDSQSGSPTSGELCNSFGAVGLDIRQSEYSSAIANGSGDPSGITQFFDHNSPTSNLYNGRDRWYYIADNPSARATKQAFQIGINGAPYNFTTVVCPSPNASVSPSASNSPSPTPSTTPSASASPSPTQSPSNTPSASTQSAPPPSGIAVTLYSGDGTSLYFCSSAGTSFQAFVSSSADAAALIDCASTNAVVIYSNDSLSTPYNGNDNYFSPTGTVSQSRCKFRISSAGVVGSRSGACQ